MEITATELKLNLGKYLEAANGEEIIITKNGKGIARLTGINTFKYDLSELEEFEAKLKESSMLGEATAPAYGSGNAGTPGIDGASQIGHENADDWVLSHNGEPVALLQPILKQKKKRRLGFISGPPISEETDAALFESDWTDEDYEAWLNQEM